MGWFDNLIGDIFMGGSQRNNQGLNLDNRPQLTARKKTIYNNLVADKEIDEFTRTELLRELSLSNEWGYTPDKSVLDLQSIENWMVQSKSSQDEKYLNRRALSSIQKEKKERPGLAAQTILTSNLQGGTISGGAMLSKGMTSGSGPTILTKTS